MTTLQPVGTTASRVTDYQRRRFYEFRRGMNLLLRQKGFIAPNIVLMGKWGAGKSSLLNTSGAVLVDNQNLVTAAPSDTDVTHRMRFIDIQEQVSPGNTSTLLRFLDTYGVKTGRYDQTTIDMIKDGRGGGLVLNERPDRHTEAIPADRANAFIIVVSIIQAQEDTEKMKSLILSLGDGREIPSNFVVVLTKVDFAVGEPYTKNWDSPNCEVTQELKREWAKRLGVQENRVYAMCNFVGRPDEDTKIYTSGKVYELLYHTLQICKEELQKLPDAGSESVNDRHTAFSAGRAMFRRSEHGGIVRNHLSFLTMSK